MRDGIHNARIAATFLGYEDHGMFIAQVELDYGGASQGFQRVIGRDEDCREIITAILSAIGVDSWEKLKGKYCRARVENGLVRELGNVLEDDWTDGVCHDAE